jgi:hypothetical protein
MAVFGQRILRRRCTGTTTCREHPALSAASSTLNIRCAFLLSSKAGSRPSG